MLYWCHRHVKKLGSMPGIGIIFGGLNLLTFVQQLCWLILKDDHFVWCWTSSAVIGSECCLWYSRLGMVLMKKDMEFCDRVLFLYDDLVQSHVVFYFLIFFSIVTVLSGLYPFYGLCILLFISFFIIFCIHEYFV